MKRLTPARIALVLLLVNAAYFAAAPWLHCTLVPMFVALRVVPEVARICTFGDARFMPAAQGVPGFAGPYWGNLLVGIGYVVAALLLALRRRAL